MVPNDLPIEYVTIGDETQPQRDGSTIRQKKVVFYLGKFGPFTERGPADAPLDSWLPLRAAELRRQVAALHS